jgi:hypothetical protein
MKKATLLIFCLLTFSFGAMADSSEDIDQILAISDSSIYVLLNGGTILAKYANADLSPVLETDLDNRGRAIKTSGDIPIVISKSRGELVLSSYDPNTLAKTGELNINTSKSGSGEKGKPGKEEDEGEDST